MGVLVPQASSGGKPLAEAVFYSSLISTPTAPTVTPVGATGTTTWSYEITAVGNFGGQTAPSPAGSTTTGVATLSTTDYNLVSWAAPPLPAGSPGNLVYDSNLAQAIAAVGSTWTVTATIGTAAGDMNVLNGGADSAEWAFYGTGAAMYQHAATQVIAVIPGSTYTLAGDIDASAVTSGLARLMIYDPTGTTVYGEVDQTVGVAGEVSAQITIPAGVDQVIVFADVAMMVAPSGSLVPFSQIQLTETSTVQPYEPGPLWTYKVYRDVGGTYEYIGETTTLALEDTGQAATAVSPPADNLTAETHYLDAVGLFPGTVTEWTRGGLSGLTTIQALRSDGLFVRFATPAAPLTVPWPSQSVSISDYECTPTVAYGYTITVVAVTAGLAIASLPFLAGGAVESSKWWEIDPTDPSTAVAAQIVSFNPQVTEQSAAHLVMGQTFPNVVANAMGGTDGAATFETFDVASYNGLQKLLLSQRVIFLSDPIGDQYGVDYVRFGPQSGGMSTGVGNKTKDANLHPSTASAPHRTTQVTWVAQPRPPA